MCNDKICCEKPQSKYSFDTDYKYEIQEIADNIAEQEYACLLTEIGSDNEQIRIYNEAIIIWNEKVNSLLERGIR